MRLSSRITLAMVILVLLTSAAVGILSYRNLVQAILPSELQNLEVHAQRLALNLESRVRGARADVLAASARRPVNGLMQTLFWDDRDSHEGLTEPQWWMRLSAIFHEALVANPDYVKFRFIGVDDDGRELVRVDRMSDGRSIRVIPKEEMQQKADRFFAEETLRLQPGEVYVSPIDLNQEHGVIATPHMPTLRISTPIQGPDDLPFGYVILNLDMRPAFAALRSRVLAGSHLYLVNERGDFLIHPDTSREFAWEFASPYRIQDEFPELESVLSGEDPYTALLENPDGRRLGTAVVPFRLAGGPRLALIQTVPYSVMMAPAESVRRATLMAGAGAALAAILLAVFLARSLARPLVEMTKAIETFTGDEPIRLKVQAPGEISVLARAFEQMTDEVRQKRTALEEEIEERRRIEATLKRSYEEVEFYEALVRSAEDAISTENEDGIITSWNAAAERMYGYTAEEVIGQSIDVIVPEGRREEFREILERVRHGEHLEGIETDRIRKDGREIQVSLTVFPIRTLEGNIRGIAKIARNITAQRQSEEKFRLAVESSPNGLIMVSEKGLITLVNAEAEHMFGYTREELIGKMVDELVPGRLQEVHVKYREEYARHPDQRLMGEGRDLYGLRKNGTEFPVEVGLNPIRTSEGLFVLAVVIDITQRKRAEARIVNYMEELKRSNAELEQFAYIASHDLQEPLRMVASYTELLAERYEGQLDEKADKYIHYAVDGAKRMKQLVNDLLAFSRVGTRGKELAPTDADAVVRQVLETLKGRIEESGAAISVEALPTVRADAGQLGQVFQNLLGNALKFCKGSPAIHIGGEVRDGECVFSIQDNGIGIDTAYAERIFQMFQRLHPRGEYDGSGIGLAIVKKIVERHGGRIWFESTQGEGTVFYFTIPLEGGHQGS